MTDWRNAHAHFKLHTVAAYGSFTNRTDPNMQIMINKETKQERQLLYHSVSPPKSLTEWFNKSMIGDLFLFVYAFQRSQSVICEAARFRMIMLWDLRRYRGRLLLCCFRMVENNHHRRKSRKNSTMKDASHCSHVDRDLEGTMLLGVLALIIYSLWIYCASNIFSRFTKERSLTSLWNVDLEVRDPRTHCDQDAIASCGEWL